MVLLLTSLFALGLSSIWLDVPFIQQEKHGCGAACISMIMQYWSQPVDTLEIQRVLYSKEAKGIFARDMERYFKGKGFRTFTFAGQWIDLEQHLSKGRPLIVCVREGPQDSSLHYMVLAGLDNQGISYSSTIRHDRNFSNRTAAALKETGMLPKTGLFSLYRKSNPQRLKKSFR